MEGQTLHIPSIQESVLDVSKGALTKPEYTHFGAAVSQECSSSLNAYEIMGRGWKPVPNKLDIEFVVRDERSMTFTNARIHLALD